MRLVFVDTETTGLLPNDGHRIVEVACIEIIDNHLTGRHFHQLVNPHRPVPPEAVTVHGIDDRMLQFKPRFAQISGELTAFVGSDMVVMHNAPFDAAFFASEFEKVDAEFAPLTRQDSIIDTLPIFRARHPGLPCRLETLCNRHGIAPPPRENWHGALTDARMLALLWLATGISGSACSARAP